MPIRNPLKIPWLDLGNCVALLGATQVSPLFSKNIWS